MGIVAANSNQLVEFIFASSSAPLEFWLPFASLSTRDFCSNCTGKPVALFICLHICLLVIGSVYDGHWLVAISAISACSCLSVSFQFRRLSTWMLWLCYKSNIACNQVFRIIPIHSKLNWIFRWVTPFAMTIRDQGLASLRSFRKVTQEDSHNIQTHINTIATLVSQFTEFSRFTENI